MPEEPGWSAQRKSSHPVVPGLLRSIRTIGPPPPVATAPSVTSEYCFGGGAIPHAPARLWPASLPMAKPPAFRKPVYPGSGYQRSPSSRGSSTPSKVDDALVPTEAGAAPVDHEAIVASVSVAVLTNARIPVVPVAYLMASRPVL